jgi:CubicO group peptidase (beta-lactamase class C family)
MKKTATALNDSNIKKHATGYKIKFPKKKREPLEHVPANVMHAATGLSSTVDDLITFYQAHFFGNETLIDDFIKREMQRIQFKTKEANWGLGFNVLTNFSPPVIGHSGGYPGFITRSGFKQENKIIAVVLTNAIDGPATQFFLGIFKLLELLQKKKAKFEVKTDKEIPDFNEIIGFYESDWGISLFSQIGPKLVGINPNIANPAEMLQIYEHKEDFTFTAPKKPFSASPGQDIEFIDGPEGEKIFVDSHGGKNKRFTFEY